MDWYRGRTILITGASGGIGEAMARLVAPARPTLLLAARSTERLEAVAEATRRLGADAHVYSADLAQPGAGRVLHEAVTADGHPPDVLVNNAGFGTLGPLLRYDAALYEEMITLNVTNLVTLTRLALPEMIARRHGGILNVASTAAYVPIPHFAVYAATKTFVKAFTDALHGELRRSGVHVSCLLPGPTQTGFFDRAAMQGSPGGLGVADPATVALAGLNALARNRRAENVLLLNRALAVASRVTPVAAALAVGAWMMRKAE